jgi:hypothetical protein
MEGLVVSFLDACERESLPEIKHLFESLVIASKEVCEVSGESFLVWVDDEEERECNYFSFNHMVDTFCEKHVTSEEDPPYLVKLAFGTLHDWRGVAKSVAEMSGISETEIRSAFHEAGELEDEEEAKDFVDSRIFGKDDDYRKRVADAIEKHWTVNKRIRV